jgi:3-oxoacyl-[acyl-carrier-protein] synthase II
VGEGYLAIREGRADAVVAGGASGQVEAFQMLEAHHEGMLVDQGAPGFDPNGAVRPYDRHRAGTILGEGAAFVVLEGERRARERGARILGFVDGFGLATDGEPDREATDRPSSAIVRALRGALEVAGVDAAQLGAIAGDGRGDLTHDRREALAYREVLGAAARSVPLASIKGAVGELGEPGGVVNLITALQAMRAGRLPPTRNFVTPDPEVAELSLSAKPQAIAPGRPAAVVCRSRLGVAAALVLSPAVQ